MTPFPDEPLHDRAGLRCPGYRLFVFVVALILIAATYVLINRTKLGKAMRATFQDRDTAALMGVNIKGIYTATFAHRLGPCGRGGRPARSGVRRHAHDGRSRLAEGLCHRHPGRSRQHPRRDASAASSWRSSEEMGAGYISSGYRDAMGFLIIIIVLLFKPTGLFARAERIG